MKKAQLQIQETILVVVILVILIILGLMFFNKYNEQSIMNEAHDITLDRFDNSLLTITNMPEFACHIYGSPQNCLDANKLSIFSLLSKKSQFDRFGYKNITVFLIYPEDNNIECTPSNPTSCGVWKVYEKIPKNIKSKRIRDTPISIYLPDKEKYVIGKLIIEGYNL